MRRYSFIVTLHILGIALAGASILLLAQTHLWFSALMVLLLLLALGINLYRMQMIQIRMMRHLAESLRLDDASLSFRSPYRNRTMEQMVDELSESMRAFRTRLVERHEMDAWQKLIRVLTHEIMNSIAPIISLSETLSEREVTEKNYNVMRQGMLTIHRRSKSLLEFVENYRKLTRLPAPVRRPVSLKELLCDLHKLYPEPYIHIDIPNEDRTLQIDRAQIEQVLINLLKNAREACAHIEQPNIRVSLRDGQWGRHLARSAGQNLCPLLHHQTIRLRHRPKPVQADYEPPRRKHHRPIHTRERHLLHPSASGIRSLA